MRRVLLFGVEGVNRYVGKTIHVFVMHAVIYCTVCMDCHCLTVVIPHVFLHSECITSRQPTKFLSLIWRSCQCRRLQDL